MLPLAPIIVAGARTQDPRGPLALALGLAIAFGLGGGLLASLGVELGDAPALRAIAAAILLVAGLVILIPMLSATSEHLLSPLAGWGDAISRRLPSAGLAGQAAAGAALAFAWAPCAGPSLGAAFALAASGGSLLMAMATMSIFALGAALSLLAAGYGLGRLAARGRLMVGRSAMVGKAAFGVALVRRRGRHPRWNRPSTGGGFRRYDARLAGRLRGRILTDCLSMTLLESDGDMAG